MRVSHTCMFYNRKKGSDMHYIKRYLFFVFLITFVLFAQACNSKKDTVAVTFNSNGGTQVDQLVYKVGAPIKLPLSPTKQGYTFDGWFIDNQVFLAPYSQTFDLSLVSSKTLDVYAKWQLNEFTINFSTDGGSIVLSIKHSILTTKSIAPEIPTKAGSIWFTTTFFMNKILLYSKDIRRQTKRFLTYKVMGLNI